MTGLKLAQLPDRVPVKITITVLPDLKKALDDYALLYSRAYGTEEQIAELIPYMLDGFLKADMAFRKGRKELQDTPSLPIARHRRTKQSVMIAKGRIANVYHRSLRRHDRRLRRHHPDTHDPCQTPDRGR
jgi:hypothetical protein